MFLALYLCSYRIYFEPHNILTHPIIQLHHSRLNQLQLIGRINLRRLSDRPKTTSILRNNPHQLRRDPQAGEHVITRLILD